MLSHHLSTTIFNIDEVQRRHNQRICFSFFIIICRIFVLSWSSHTFYSEKKTATDFDTQHRHTMTAKHCKRWKKKLKMNVITDTYINLLSDWVIMIITCVCCVVYLLLWFVCVMMIIKIIMMKKVKDDDDEQHGWSW